MTEGGGRDAGFTIIEVMIVLAVTGMLFVAAVILINGQQNRTQFMTAANTFQQQMQQIINETANGYYPDRSQYTCRLNPFASAGPISFSAGQADADRQGTNPNCVFMGKTIQFAPGGLFVFNTEQSYLVYSMVGRRMASTITNGEASTLYGATGALPRAAAPGNNHYDIGISNATYTTAKFTQGAKVKAMWYDGDRTNNTTSVVGFISTLPGQDSNGLLASGAQVLQLYVVPGTKLNTDDPGTVIDDMYPVTTTDGSGNTIYQPTNPLTRVGSVSVCVASGTTKQSALITIGAAQGLTSASGLAVTSSIKSGTSC